jgi:hypothetical protein
MMTSSYEKIRAFTVTDNTDHSEGRGRSFVKAYTTSEACAERLSKRGYVQGTDNPIGETTLVKVGDMYFPLSARVGITNPTKEDLERDDFMKSFDGIIEKALLLV